MVSVLRYGPNGNPLDSLSQDLADGHARNRNASRPSRARSRVELSLLRDRSLTARFALGLIATWCALLCLYRECFPHDVRARSAGEEVGGAVGAHGT